MVVRAAAELRLVEQLLDLRELGEHRLAVLGELRGARVELAAQRRGEQGRLHGFGILPGGRVRPPKCVDTLVTFRVMSINRYFHPHGAADGEGHG